jgi:uncharacterized LabA/DUF88 family protein
MDYSPGQANGQRPAARDFRPGYFELSKIDVVTGWPLPCSRVYTGTGGFLQSWYVVGMRTYLFIDAENHYWRSMPVIEEIFGACAGEALSSCDITAYAQSCFPHRINGRRFGWNRELLLFWDCMGLSPFFGDHTASLISRAIYATAMSGDVQAHSAKVSLRKMGFEPIVVVENKDLRRQRTADREKLGLLDKPKGCDVALVTRMVADAAADLYDCCCLFTSDADYLPAIEVIRRMGKTVVVGGYARALPERSPYLHVPDQFVDLEEHLRNLQGNYQHVIEPRVQELQARAAAAALVRERELESATPPTATD